MALRFQAMEPASRGPGPNVPNHRHDRSRRRRRCFLDGAEVVAANGRTALPASRCTCFDRAVSEEIPVSPPEPASLPRLIETASGERLLFREVESGDLAALHRLYDGLDLESTYRRFFTATRPPDSYLEHLTDIAGRGGCSIVVVDLTRPTADGVDPPIVAEADFVRLANGNGELAVTVEKSWRGWLGPYLFGLLREQAARRGIANLEAEILTCNRQMRSLTRRAGEAAFAPEDWQTIRVVIASAGPAPSWSAAREPKVLVELRSFSTPALAELVTAGYQVLACTGRRHGGPPCPMLTGDEDCPLAAGADVIVIAERDAQRRQQLLDAHRVRHSAVPVVALDLDPDHPFTGADLKRAVDSHRPKRGVRR